MGADMKCRDIYPLFYQYYVPPLIIFLVQVLIFIPRMIAVILIGVCIPDSFSKKDQWIDIFRFEVNE